MATLNELFETYINDNYEGTMSQAAIVKAYELLLGLTGNFADKAARVQYWVDKDLAVSEFLDEFLAAAARLSEANAAAWGETTTERTAVVNAAQNAVSTSLSLEEVGTVVANARASYDPQSFNLTTGVDQGTDFTGGVADDTFTANNTDSPSANSDALSDLDALDGGAGNDTLAIVDTTADGLDTGDASGLTLTGIESVTVRSANAATVDLSTQTDVTSVAITTAGAAVDLDGASTQALSVSGASAAIAIDGGSSVTVTDATANQNITVGAATTTTGAISVTDSKQGTGNIVVDGGSDVTVTATIAATTAAVSGGDITVGANTAATGTSTVVQNLTSNGGDADADDLSAANIAVTGGTSIDITVNATSTAQNDDADGDILIGTIGATADTNTTSITVTQNATATTVETAQVDAVKETDVVTFKAMDSSETLIVNGLTFTAAKDLTAEEVAAAFSNIAESGTIGGAPSADGEYTGTFNTAVWSSGSANGAVVTFTAQDDNETDLTFSGTATTNDAGARAPVQDKTAGTALVAADESTNVVTAGQVTIDDNATAASVTTITVDGYGASSRIGTTNDTTALTTLSLANTSADMTVDDTAETLALNLEALGTASSDATVTLSSAPTTLNVTSTGNNYVDLTAAATTALTVAGTGVLDADATDLAALETVTVTGSAGVALNSGVADTVTAVDASATSGNVTISINGTLATYAGSTGVDTVTLATGTSLSKAIDLGAGDDTLVFGAAVTTSSTTLSGGDGTDSLSMSVANADTLDTSTQSFYTNFERLVLNTAAGDDDNTADTVTIDVEKLGLNSYVTTNGTLLDTTAAANSDTLVLDNLANNGTVVIAASAAGANTKHTVNIKDAATGTSDALNLMADVSTADVNYGVVTAANVETINLTSNDTDQTAAINTTTVTVTADKATTVNVDGSANIALTLTGSTKVTAIDASDMAGNLTVTSANTATATTITGGAGDDNLTGAADADVLLGGAGNDTLTAGGNLATLTGGAGNDTFVMNTADTVNDYSTITDLSTGDVIDTDAATFQASAITLGDTAVFQDYANAAVNAVAADGAAWFQLSGNTYLVVDDSTGNSTSYVNGTDQIIKISGLVDLSEAAFSTTTGDLTII